MPLNLAPHIHACCDKGVVVLLDLRANRYLALPDAAVSLTGTPIGGLPSAANALTGAGVALLRRQGALVETCIVRPAFDEKPSIRDKIQLDTRPRITANSVLGFTMACLEADSAVRAGKLQGAIASTLRKKETPREGDAVLKASVFARLRPWYPHARICLFDSLALAHFLARHGCRFELVFAVRARPFAAHCWVESAGRALNDFYDTHAAFTPIMRV
jgi:hypothetical protein